MKHAIINTAALAAIIFIFSAGTALAHCDTLDGPVIESARKAIESRDITPVLKWVREQDEAELKEAFRKTLKVRQKGESARELADRYFFETLVRIHREGEGAPYTGLKPAGAVEPAVRAADRALESGSADRLIELVTADVEEGIRKRFAHVSEARRHKDESVEQGREFVKAYVIFTHYVEKIHMLATHGAMHHGGGGGEEGDKH